MAFAFDHIDGGVWRWSRTKHGVECERDEDYTPSFYASTESSGIGDLRGHLSMWPDVDGTAIEEWRRGFRHEPEQVLRVDVDEIEVVRKVASEVRGWDSPGEYRLYNVDFSREFRYCLETDTDPTPAAGLTTMEIVIDPQRLANGNVDEIQIDGKRFGGKSTLNLECVREATRSIDPDVVIVNASEVLPTLYEAAERYEVEDFQLGRRPRFEQLAGRSTYESYGQVGHSPARYNLPGRVIIDRSNTFFLSETNLDGCLDLVGRSRKPLQELAWASIGNILTAIQIREARDRGVLVPWNSWRHEDFKTMNQLHEADRGGFTFAPDVGVHQAVHELDFSSLYPNIICQHNVSPEMVRCECHSDREDVPEIGYSICDERGYLPDVLQPLIDDRDAIKAEIREMDDPDRREGLEGRSSAIKWILVSCFGYQGFSNAKFGRIECHEAINAFAREILLDAKEALEAGGWRVVHGIVDSIWVQAVDHEKQTPLDELAEQITEESGIRLEHEAQYEWVAFVPMRDSEAGALTKYFGKKADSPEGDAPYKYRGIECRQRSTPAFIEGVQKELIDAIDDHQEPELVCDVLATKVATVERGEVDPSELAIKNRVSKPREEYSHETRNVAALERAADLGMKKHPGENVSYVVVDDSKPSRERVCLASEDPSRYDSQFYRDQLVRAAESVLSPFGWRRSEIEAHLSDREDTAISAF
ncbi:type B DNA-directed DNA polymerase [Halococcus sp. PRR34]|uniref:type B DNA-directed DNA polymerase n=1 Tax=Halococcus sp. PRR34 TaxID=3020830 RepID=UPI0023608E58|nr:type B DNA-directed DNA polymerase [Halococcus sp. PRR34]